MIKASGLILTDFQITASQAGNPTENTQNAPSGRTVSVLAFALSLYYHSVQPLRDSHEMKREAPQGNEIRASERNSSKSMPEPAQIHHVQATISSFKMSRFSVSWKCLHGFLQLA